MDEVEMAQKVRNENKKKTNQKKRELTVTGSIDDSSLVAPRWHPPELRGGIAVL